MKALACGAQRGELEMSDFADGILILLTFALPVAGYLVALRTRTTRAEVLMAATLGGAVAGVFLLLVIGMRSVSLDLALESWPFAAFATVNGAVIGLIGLGARSLGEWLQRRP
jgi:hypothetical protein